MPDLAKSVGVAPTARTHGEKATLLAERFFPQPQADLRDIKDTDFQPETYTGTVRIRQQVTSEDVADTLRKMSPWKAPGNDLLPTGFLKMYGKPLHQVLAKIATASFRLGHFPQQFRSALVVVLRKAGKPEEVTRTPGGWRPISLLSTIGKVIKATISDRIAEAAEEHKLLPEGQIGNRRQRSTDLAIRLITKAVRTT